MRLLLINPPGPYCRAGSRWPHTRKRRDIGIDYHPFPFGLGYAAARLRADGHEVRVADCIASALSNAELLGLTEAFSPDVIFMETSAPSFLDDVDTMRALNRPCIAGGAHATVTWRDHLEAGFAAVVLGEYDQVLDAACRLEPQPWLATKSHEPREHAPLIADLDALPHPAWDLMPMEKYNDPICRGRSVTVMSSRGCPNACAFCTVTPFQGRRRYRMRDPKSVCDEIAMLIDRYHPDEIYFDDDTITANRQHMLALCEEYKRRQFGIGFCCMGNASVDRQVLAAMAEAGCRAYKFGVESADPEVLRRIPKRIDLEQVVRTVHDCHRLGILTHATFVFGLPGENRESAVRTIDFALRLRPHTLQFAIATPYAGTPLYEQARAQGWLVKENWKEFDPAGGAVLSYPGYSAQDIEEMHALAWSRWQWFMLTRHPMTLFHHFRNAWRREGLSGVVRLGRYGAGRLRAILDART